MGKYHVAKEFLLWFSKGVRRVFSKKGCRRDFRGSKYDGSLAGYPKGSCTQIVYTLAPKCLYRDDFGAKVSTIGVHGPLRLVFRRVSYMTLLGTWKPGVRSLLGKLKGKQRTPEKE